MAIVWQTPLGVESYLAAGRTGRDSWSRTRGRERASGEVQHQASHCGGARPYRAEEFGPSSPALDGWARCGAAPPSGSLTLAPPPADIK